MVRAVEPRIGDDAAADARTRRTASRTPLFQAPGHDAGQGRSGSIPVRAGSRLTRRSAFAEAHESEMHRRGRYAGSDRSRITSGAACRYRFPGGRRRWRSPRNRISKPEASRPSVTAEHCAVRRVSSCRIGAVACRWTGSMERRPSTISKYGTSRIAFLQCATTCGSIILDTCVRAANGSHSMHNESARWRNGAAVHARLVASTSICNHGRIAPKNGKVRSMAGSTSSAPVAL